MNDTTTTNQMHQIFRSRAGWLLPFMAGTLALLALERLLDPAARAVFRPLGGGAWKNKGQYLSTLAQTVKRFLDPKRITQAEKHAIMPAAASSNCGET